MNLSPTVISRILQAMRSWPTGLNVQKKWIRMSKDTSTTITSWGGGVNVSHQNGYFNIIQYIDSKGGEIDGIGMQGHFAEFVTGIPKVFEILDRFARFNKEIKITEFDINSINDDLKVNYTRDFMTALFSYPYVKSFSVLGVLGRPPLEA
jgi:GH35 family endo-1,4-beta-xylanase